ncbi:hypothetical protein CCP4SC76_4220005 [Gammaproteobacteria bacterium]
MISGESAFVHGPQTRTASSENARFYDELVTGQRFYAYVAGDPVNETDPEGLAGCCGERGATGGSSGQNSDDPYKHCWTDPKNPDYIICKHHQTGKKIRKKKPKDFPANKSEICGTDCQAGILFGGICIICALQPELCIPAILGGATAQ